MKRKFVIVSAICAIAVLAGSPSLTARAATVSDSSAAVSTSALPDGGVLYTVTYDDGSNLSIPYPPASFDPKTASNEELALYGFDSRPEDPNALRDWNIQFENYSRGASPDVNLLENSIPQGKTFTSQYGPYWAGWEVGTQMATNHDYVAVKGNFTVPSVTTGCDTVGGVDGVGAFIGLGGETPNDDLLQQGLGWCSMVNTKGDYMPYWVAFTEFAASHGPQIFCGTSWLIPSGHVVYQNMSYQSSSNTGYFYMQDQTSGVVHSCSATKPSAWSFNGATADWIVEKPKGSQLVPNFGTLNWYNAQAETSADSTFHTIGSQPHIRLDIGSSSSSACTSTTNVTNNTYFSTDWVGMTC